MRTASEADAVILNEEGSKEKEATAMSWKTPSSATSMPEMPPAAAAAQLKVPPFHCKTFDPVHDINPPLKYCEAEAILNEPVPITDRSPEISKSFAALM